MKLTLEQYEFLEHIRAKHALRGENYVEAELNKIGQIVIDYVCFRLLDGDPDQESIDAAHFLREHKEALSTELAKLLSGGGDDWPISMAPKKIRSH